MTIGSLTVLAIFASALATLLWWLAGRLPDWVRMFLFGAALVLVVLAGPLVRLP